MPDTIQAARTALARAGTVLSASRAQDLAFTLYDLAEGENLIALCAVLSRTLTASALGSREIASFDALLSRIEAQGSPE